MGKSRKSIKKRVNKKKVGGFSRRIRRKCGCEAKNNNFFLRGGRYKKSKNKRKRNKRTKKQKGGFFREIRNIFDYGYYLGEKQAATLGGYPKPSNPSPIQDQKPNNSA